MLIVIVGAGRVGSRLIELATEHGLDVLVLDKSPERCERAIRRYDCVAIPVDATVEDNLREAEVDRADGLIAATRDDPVNLMVIGLARELGVSTRVSVVNKPEAIPMFLEQGTQVVGNPSELAAEYLYHALTRPAVRDFMRVGRHGELFKAPLADDSPLVGRLVKDVKMPEGTLFAAIERGGEVVVPRGATAFQKGDVVTVLARNELIDHVLGVLQGRNDADADASPTAEAEAPG